MNRRGFLGAMAAAIAGAHLDPERLLWVPGAKLISIPKPRPPVPTGKLFDPHVNVFAQYEAAREELSRMTLKWYEDGLLERLEKWYEPGLNSRLRPWARGESSRPLSGYSAAKCTLAVEGVETARR